MSRQLPRRDYLAIKAATRDLVEAAGGQHRAARISRVSQQTLSRAANAAPDHADRFLCLDVVADLEAECGDPLVTRQMAELSGCVLFRIPGGRGASVFHRHIAEISRESADVVVRLAEALADDGRVDRDEARRLLSDTRQAMERLAELDHRLEAIAGGEEG